MDVFAAAPLGSLTGLRALANAATVTIHAVFLYAHAIGSEEWYDKAESTPAVDKAHAQSLLDVNPELTLPIGWH